MCGTNSISKLGVLSGQLFCKFVLNDKNLLIILKIIIKGIKSRASNCTVISSLDLRERFHALHGTAAMSHDNWPENSNHLWLRKKQGSPHNIRNLQQIEGRPVVETTGSLCWQHISRTLSFRGQSSTLGLAPQPGKAAAHTSLPLHPLSFRVERLPEIASIPEDHCPSFTLGQAQPSSPATDPERKQVTGLRALLQRKQ